MNKTAKPLDKRKAFILATIVYEYVATAEPVGSQTLTQKYNLGVSSATVRNEMAELEAAGYLVQPHTSAGRVPSDSGYRTYVDELMQPQKVTPEENGRIRGEFQAASRELEEVIEQTARLLGQLSRNVAVAIAPSRAEQAFRHVQLIWLAARTGLAIVVTSIGSAAQNLFELSDDTAADDLTRFSNALNERFSGKVLREVMSADFESIALELRLPASLGVAVRDAVREASLSTEPLVAAAGAQNLLDQPEFHDLRKLRSILRILEEQKTLADLLAESVSTEGPIVRIGHELHVDEIAECSLITVPYRLAGGQTGVLAILGPRRMEYAKLLAIADSTAASLNAHLQNAGIS